MSATEWLDPDLIGNMLRTFGSVLNSCVYDLLSAMYQIFFNVSSAQLFENETIKNFYGRVQLIIGVFMVFKLAVSILQGIMDPEKFTSGKEGGFGSVITRVIVALIMLAVIVPINVPDVQNANSYEKYINNNGLLFGTLYSLQDRILSENTLGRLILGTTDDDDDDSDSSSATQQEKLKRSANIFASTILKGFLRINMRPEDEWVDDNDNNPQNWYCGEHLNDSDISDALTVYNQLDVSTGALLSSNMIHAKCNVEGGFFGDEKFLFYFNWTISLVIGVIFLVILVGFTIDIAVRSVKLAILRLLAPIPIISYIEPKSAKDGMFASWVKSLTSTYLDLFLRLAIVYFVIFIIQDMMVNGIVIDQAGGMVGIVSVIFIWIGLFFFAKMAPKFIKDALGIKGPGMTNIGLSGILGGSAMLSGGMMNGIRNAREEGTSLIAGALKGAGAGFAMGAMGATDAQIQGYNQNKPQTLGSAWSQNRALMRRISTGDKDAKGTVIDWLNYQNRNMAAGAAGYSKRNMAIADRNKKMLQKAYGDAKGEYEDAQNALRAFANMNGPMRESDPARYNETYSRLYDRVRAARTRRDNLEVAVQRASGAASTIEKYRSDVYQAAPRAMDTTRRTYRSSLDVVDHPTLDDQGHVIKAGRNFESSAEPFDPYKGSDGVTRVDSDFPMDPPPPPPGP